MHINLGELENRLGAAHQARDHFDRSEVLLRSVGEVLELGKLLCIRAEFEHDLGDPAASRRALEEAATLERQLGTPDGSLTQTLSQVRSRLG